MPGTMRFDPPVGLHNCDREPIHIPGSIQPHGALLAFDALRRLAAFSANAARVLRLPTAPGIGDGMADLGLGADFESAIERVFDGVPPGDLNPIRAYVRGQQVDGIMHRGDDLVIVEFEPLPESARPLDTFAVAAHQALAALQRKRDVPGLLRVAVSEVHRLTGFDRVMAYRFRPDGSGEVVAEQHAERMEAFLGLRYPATDIPAQARRLYVQNPLRLIADVAGAPSDLVTDAMRPPIDQSLCTLRSVSPIHIEYLRNMGVGASMSVSIVVDGRLWGLIACHHRAPRAVPYTARMACLLMAQSLEMLVERAEHGERREMADRSMTRLERVGERLEREDDLLAALNDDDALHMLDVGGFAACMDGRIVRLGATPEPEDIAELIRWLAEHHGPLMSTSSISRRNPPAIAFADVASGVLAARFHAERSGYALWFRPELRHVVRWAGNPDKSYATGPNGPRLTPRGSFAEWQQSVVATAEDWHAGEIELAEALRRKLVDAALRRATEVQRMRDLFIGVLGHDLRNPVAAISMAARVVSRTPDRSDRMNLIGATLDSTSRRMSRLIDQMLDFSRLRAGESMGLVLEETDLRTLVDTLVAELALGHPGSDFAVEYAGDATACLDPDRMAQVISNLIGNARHHGAPGRPIRVRVQGHAAGVQFEVFNEGEPIPPALMGELFSPFKKSGRRSPHSSGLGLGLYITDQIVRAHRGTIQVQSDADGTVFRVDLPRSPATD